MLYICRLGFGKFEHDSYNHYMQAVFRLDSSQYLVTPGEELLISSPVFPPGHTLSFDQVLLLIDGDEVQVGQPVLAGARVTAEVLGEVKGLKIRVAKYKAKSRYRKTLGFRPRYLKIKINSITSSTAPPTTPTSRKRVKSTI